MTYNPIKYKEWYKKNEVRLKEYRKKWREDNREHCFNYKKKWIENNPEYHKKWYKDNFEKRKEYERKYRKTPKGRMIDNIKKHRRRTALGSFTANEWEEKKKEFNYCCVLCGTKDNLTIDHILSILKGGTNFIENIQPLCRSCNSKKGSK